ncbi:hypothetical protein M9H77_08953 [Catharanthus roseus]|uniref:Uncharacterized protein n=1 Tax=Catharanthus roseus TaxID=4058 RepID=A0ACC0BZK5_CATRO|nr:hypothetical protein M9H77_08953 [Catharanthus roseus]
MIGNGKKLGTISSLIGRKWNLTFKKGSTAHHIAGDTAYDIVGSTDSHITGSFDSSITGSTDTSGSGSTDIDTDSGPRQRSQLILHTDHTIVIIYGSCSLKATSWLHPSSRVATRILALYRSGSSSLTTVGLRSHRMSVIYGGKSFRNINEAPVEGGRGLGSGKAYRWFYILCRSSVEEEQADLTDRFSKSRHLEALHNIRLRIRRDTTGTPMPNDLQLISTISGGLSRDWLYGAGSEAAHLRAENSRAAVRFPLAIWKWSRGS